MTVGTARDRIALGTGTDAKTGETWEQITYTDEKGWWGVWVEPGDCSLTFRLAGYITEDGETVYIPRSERESREWKVRIQEPDN